jgi:hypothetical protein
MMKVLLLTGVLGMALQSFAADGFNTEPYGRTLIERDQHVARTDSILFSEDFENDWNGWQGIDLTATDPVWHASDFFAFSGNSWWSGDEALGGYDNHWLQYLDTPAVTITSANATLSFQLQYATEAPGGEPAGYDGWDGCNVWMRVDGGEWTVADGFSHAYDVTSLYSFGDEWNMGPGIPGWAGSADWQEVTLDLSSYQGSAVEFRFAFCSDPAYCTSDNGNIWGMQIDDVMIDDDGTTLLHNDADGTATPSDLIPTSGASAGQNWSISDQESNSPSHSANCAPGYGLSNALVSPAYQLPAEMDTWLEFFILSDMLDADGSGDNSLEDYYHIEISNDGGITWDLLFYDYTDVSRPGGNGAWEDFIPGLPFNNNIEMSLNEYAGDEIHLRFRMTTDYDDDGGVGTGLWIDDVEIWGSDVPGNDMACINIVPGFPRTEGMATDVFVEYANNGSSDLTQVQAWFAVNEVLDGPILPRFDIPSLSTDFRLYSWTPDGFGQFDLKSYASNADDQVPANDTLWAGPFDINPAGTVELGYSYLDPSYYFSGGDPAMYVTMDPDWGIESIELNTITVGLYDPDGNAGGNVIRLHVMEDAGAVPGTEIWNGDFTLTTQGALTLWEFEVDAGVIVSGDFWIWAERLSDYPHGLGADLLFNGGHYAITDGIDFDLDFSNEVDGNELTLLCTGTVLNDLGDEISLPVVFELEPAFPNPFNPVTQLRFRANAGEQLSLVIYNLQGQEVARLYDGKATGLSQTVAFDGSALASGVYMARLEGSFASTTQKLVLVK